MINQGTIILLGVVLWLVTLAISIVFVMRYAKKVKANKFHHPVLAGTGNHEGRVRRGSAGS